MRPLFAGCGRNVKFNPFDEFYHKTIKIGDDVYIGAGACFVVTEGLTIGNKVMFGPHVTIMGGDHNTSVLGSYMFDVDTKRPDDDLPVTIEDDVWVGARAVILKGVTIRRGSVVGAGAVVTRDTPPYSVVAGVPAKVIGYRWPLAEIIEHEEKLYAEEDRLNKDELAHIQT
ncbi:MAG: acyltransferase [Planctomycetota bacterium]|jgi:acetyltransferase-like isoleucine patch superfamily enzyme